MNYYIAHHGKRSESELQVKGALKDKAFKLFRGTIDLKTGASGSKGREYENVLLLGEDVVNQSIPLILCTEEDVEGSHGAAIGSLDDEMMFYLMSRGIDEAQAKKLVISGIFNRLLKDVDDEEIVSRIGETVQEA